MHMFVYLYLHMFSVFHMEKRCRNMLLFIIIIIIAMILQEIANLLASSVCFILKTFQLLE